ncbi:hypothetical protein KVR01_007046 [Diaporthe batatas]|uniref:uncharacterized protein n=1 Tax=Diaporthe batatas TaxID=748121 RepID=UPI001D051661|nr:uncharacterized protein KVR01_007046 [Diaporthe batatas]KAG8163749.1 hypothetical protein KVR01_007046 [Diaporthe batatas]
MMVSSFHDGPSQASTMHMPAPVEGFHNAEPAPNAAHSYQYSQHHQQQRRKRKAETQDAHNERLSKRLSLLNLEQNGSKLYVPVEQPSPSQPANNASSSSSSSSSAAAAAVPGAAMTAGGDEMMLLDDTKHKVYIYNLDDELSSDADSDPDDARLVFLPDVERHLRANRIVPGIPGTSVPRPILPNKDGELAGMQLVLYDDGVRSVSVPEEQDSVRKAIIEARERHRRRQQDERDARAVANNPLLRPGSRATFATPVKVAPGQMQPFAGGGAASIVDVDVDAPTDGDADAMEID